MIRIARHIMAVMAFLAILLAAALARPALAAAADPDGVVFDQDPGVVGSVHQLFNYQTMGCLDIRNNERSTGGILQAYTCMPQENQRFTFTKVSASTFRVGAYGSYCITGRNVTSSNPDIVTDVCGKPSQTFRWGQVHNGLAQIVETTTGKCWYDDGIRDRLRLRACGSDPRMWWYVDYLGEHRWGQPIPGTPGNPGPAPAPSPVSLSQTCIGNAFAWRLTANATIPAGSTWRMSASIPRQALRVTSNNTSRIPSATGGTSSVPLRAATTIPAGTVITLTPSYHWVPTSGTNVLTLSGYQGVSSSAGFNTTNWPCR